MRKKNITLEYLLASVLNIFIFKPIELLFKYRLSRNILSFIVGILLLININSNEEYKLIIILIGIILIAYPFFPLVSIFNNRNKKNKKDISKVK